MRASFLRHLSYFRRLEESEKKRQAMMQAVKEQSKKGPNFTITKKDLSVSIWILISSAKLFFILSNWSNLSEICMN